MTVDVILYWIAFALICVGVVVTFTRWWDRGYMFLALGLAVLGTACLWRGWWWEDAALAALCFTFGLGITYLAYRKERKHGKQQVVQGQADGELPERAGGLP